MFRLWYFSTGKRHPRGQGRIAAKSGELEAASKSLRSTAAALPNALPGSPPLTGEGPGLGQLFKTFLLWKISNIYKANRSV